MPGTKFVVQTLVFLSKKTFGYIRSRQQGPTVSDIISISFAPHVTWMLSIFKKYF